VESFRKSVVVCILWCLLASGVCVGQRGNESGRFGKLATSSLFQHANYLSENAFYHEAISEYEKIANENLGTDTEATARLLLAHQLLETSVRNSADPDDRAQLVQRAKDQLGIVRQSFPQTRFSFVSRVMLIEGFGTDEWQRSELDKIFVELGAPTFVQILSDEAPSFHESMVASDLRADLSEAYETQRLGLDEQAQARLAIFLISSFPITNGRIGGSRDFFLRKVRQPALTWDGVPPGIPTEPDLEAPQILERIPDQGQVVSPDSAVTIAISDGNRWSRKVDQSVTRLSLDGIDVSSRMRWSLRNDLAQDAQYFQTFTITYQPEQGFSQGVHTVKLETADRGLNPNTRAYEWNFVVSSKPDSEMSSQAATQDTLLSFREPHQNEGINRLLTLEKSQGKATRSVVAFNLSETNLSGLSRATLVLTIDSRQAVNGWGTGRTISAQAITEAWEEGNGRSFGLKKKDQIAGNGAGATWFSPTDEDISNDSANSTVNWNGAAYSAASPTALPVVISNGLSGEVAFDVTADVLNGAEHGWLILKDQENVGSKVSFYSREGAAAAGNPDLAPRLLLEFGQVASNSSEAQSETLLSRIGFGAVGSKLRPVSGSEVRSVKQLLQENQIAALAVEQLVSQATLTNPVANWTTRLAYRSWISESIQIAANLEMARFQA